MVRQHREVVVIEEQRERRIMLSSAAPSPSSSPTSNTNSSSDDSNSISPSSQDSATPSTIQPDAYDDDITTPTDSSPPPPSKAPPPSSPPPSSPPPPQSSPPPSTANANSPPKTSPSPPPPSPESDSPPAESSEPPPTSKSPPESPQSDFVPPPPPPPSQSGSVQPLSIFDSDSPQPPSSSTSPPASGKTPSSTSSSPPTSSNDSPPPPPIAATASLFSQSAVDATPNSSKSPTQSPSPTTLTGTASSSSSPSSSSSSNGTSSNSTPTSSSSNGTASPSNETSNSTPASSSSSSSSSPPPPGNIHTGAVEGAIVGAVAGVLIILLLGILLLFVKRRRKRVGPYANSYHPPPNFPIPPDPKNYYGQTMVFSGEYGYAHNSSGSQQGGSNMYRGGGGGGGGGDIGGSKSIFSYEELMEITSGFSRQNIIGEGGFGCVFRGQLPDGRAVAVKQLKAGSGQGEREFRAEVEIISRVHHRHLVSLVGYCIAEHRRLLIYEFVPNNTLEHHLHGNAMPVLDWTKRLKIALGSAKGLAYLHEDCHPKIIHRDIKSANILLDDAFEAQVADFGLAKLTNDANTHVSTRVMGTFGYLAPEYASSGKLTDRSDVFSFGVVLLELLTGRKPVDSSQPLGDESLVEWARPRLVKALESGDFSELVDPRLGKSYVESELVRMMEAAVACIRHSAPKRPRMAQVVRALDCDEELSDLSNGVKYGQSTIYNSEQYSQDIIRFRRMAEGDGDSMEYESTASKPPSSYNQSSWKSPESSIGLGNSYGREMGP